MILKLKKEHLKKPQRSLMCPCSTVEEHSTHIPKVEGLNPATGTGREKIAKGDNLSWKCQN